MPIKKASSDMNSAESPRNEATRLSALATGFGLKTTAAPKISVSDANSQNRKIFTSEISKKKSQPSRISWSQRKRGRVQRTHIKTKITTATLVKNTAMLISPKT